MFNVPLLDLRGKVTSFHLFGFKANVTQNNCFRCDSYFSFSHVYFAKNIGLNHTNAISSYPRFNIQACMR